ncbi:LysR family transcriptional regulator [Robbsia andropogonis]|uniref:LysR family transcriptional regulator n=1 Tax=Robbsia andropogonis TaxID=28092 RepID=A0A0F5JWM6_9BURK|nr:LysR family transcriptional regulator [Robbsia andropogonis]KKB62110.1 LysR family transcriptional regulator [Robbsia andropogonis]
MSDWPSDTRVEKLSTRGMHYLHTIERHGGIRAAADALGINPSAISRKIAQMETAFDVVLLQRRGRGVVVSDVGMSVIEYFRDRQRRENGIVMQLEAYRGLRQGRVTIAVGEGFVENLLAGALSRFSGEYPDIVVDLRAGATAQVLAMVRDDVADLGLCAGASREPAIRARAFKGAPICALVSPDHDLAKQEVPLRVADLAAHRLIFMPEHFAIQQYVDAMARAEGMTLSAAVRCDLFSAAQAIAAAGLGVAFMSRQTARLYVNAGLLVALDIDHPIARDFSRQLVRRVGRRASPAAAYLWRQLGEALLGGAVGI